MSEWEQGEIPGTWKCQLENGFVVTLGHSDANYPPGTPEPRLNVNTSALWMRVDLENHEAMGIPFPLGWWARIHSVRSLHRVQEMIVRNGYTLPVEIACDYWQARVFELEEQRARASAFYEKWLSEQVSAEKLTETFSKLLEHDNPFEWPWRPK